jgi:hypothetical protein
MSAPPDSPGSNDAKSPDPLASVDRHFPNGIDLDDPAGRALAIATLLEDGDRDDLSWLLTRVTKGEIETWFRRHGARRLSRRSRAFWAAAFGLEPLPAPATAQALWPLA